MQNSNFVRKKVKSLTLGEKLRQLRKDRRISVRDLARRINVKVSYIEALEMGRYDILPTKVYVKGFVRSYARFFGVPEDVLLDLFEREYCVYQNINYKETEDTVNKLPKVPRFIFTPRVIATFISIIILAAVGIYLYFGVDNFISSPWLVVEAPLNNSVVKTDKVTVKGKTRSSSHVFINGQQVFVDMDGIFSEDVTLTPGINMIIIKSVNKFDKETQEEIVVNADYELQEEKEESDNTKNMHIVVKAIKEPVWINIIADGVDVYNDTLQLDEEKMFDAKEKISLTTSNGSHTLVSDDEGKTFEPISDENGIVRGWVYESQNGENKEKQEITETQ